MKSDPTPIEDSTDVEVAGVEVVIVDANDADRMDLGKVVDDTIQLLKQGRQAVNKGWKDIMAGSLRLCWLNRQHSAQGTRNDLVPDERKSGFRRVLNELALPPETAYRWMRNVRHVLLEIGVSDSNIPIPGSDEWTRMERFVCAKIEVLRLLGLKIQMNALPKDEEIMTRLRAAAVAGDKVADQVLSELDAGEIEMEEATQKYCRSAKPAPGKRPPPAMLRLNPKTLQPEGRLVKALATIEEAFGGWDEFPFEVQIQARQRIREVLAKMPANCKFQAF